MPILALTRPQEAAQPHQRLCYLHKPHGSSLSSPLPSSHPAQGHFLLIAVQREGGWCQELQTNPRVTRAAGWASPNITQTQPCLISAAQKDSSHGWESRGSKESPISLPLSINTTINYHLLIKLQLNENQQSWGRDLCSVPAHSPDSPCSEPRSLVLPGLNAQCQCWDNSSALSSSQI